jgi:lysophospholipase L1-like esterase
MARRRAARPVPGWFRPVAALLVLAVVILLGEGVAQVVDPLVPNWYGIDNGTVIMVGHPTRLWGLGAGERRNGDAVAHIAETGLRSPLPETPRPQGRARVLVLGDSTFFGHGVGDADTIPAQLGELLRAHGLDVDTVNGAVPGYSTEQSLRLLDDVGWTREPTLLLIGNLWSDNNFDHFRDADLLRTRELYFRHPLAKSALFRVTAAVVDKLRGGDAARVVTWTRDSAWPATGSRRVPVQAYARNLDTMIRAAAARGIGAALASPCNLRMARGLSVQGDVWDTYFRVQGEVARHHRIPVIRTEAAMRVAAKEVDAEALYVDDMHPSPPGARIMAAALAAGLLEAGWPGNPLLARAEAFDAASVRDGDPDGMSEITNPRSPQTNLFPHTAEATRGEVTAP